MPVKGVLKARTEYLYVPSKVRQKGTYEYTQSVIRSKAHFPPNQSSYSLGNCSRRRNHADRTGRGAWSVFRIPLTKAFGWTISQVTFTFTIAILMLGFAAFVGGLWMRRSGPRIVAIAAGISDGLGLGLNSRDRMWSRLHLPREHAGEVVSR